MWTWFNYFFVMEAIKNIPPGWKARETYRIVGPDEFIEVFELYTENRFQRMRSE
jgi:hypothetical protein